MIGLRKIVLQSGCFLACCTSTLAQDLELKLFVYKNDKPVEKFGIANISSKVEGEFVNGYHLIKAEEGDELFIASVEFNNFHKIVSKADIEQGYIEVYFKDDVIVLDEVILNHNTLSYGRFTSNNPKTYTPAEARLKAATKIYYKDTISKYAYEEPAIRLALDPLINLISGRTKRLKKELKVEQSDIIVSFLHTYYRRFILEELKVPKTYYHLFCYYVSDNNKGIHKINDTKRVEFIIRRLYLKFLDQTTSEF
ncbi:hypothetical protein [Galbibacter sp.]|uniref:hypothetical protein n=1 Tax=Galbibacter sp. TaxID=2918471 RepID=UPI003A92B6C4